MNARPQDIDWARTYKPLSFIAGLTTNIGQMFTHAAGLLGKGKIQAKVNIFGCCKFLF